MKRYKVVIAALAVSLLAATPIGQMMNISSVAYASQNETETDPKSGLTRYKDYNLEKYGYTDSSGNIVIPAQWERADKFYAGYAMVVDDIRGEALDGGSRMYKAHYRIIDESGQTVGDFYYSGDWTMGRNGYMGQKLYPYRFGENDKGLFGHLELKDADTGALLYVKFYINGEVEYIECPQFIIKTENNIYTRYNIGTFRNGTANIYKFTGTESLSMTGEGNWSKRQAIASITVDGEVLDEINPDSEWKENGEMYPDYGVNQFASVSDPAVEEIVEGWKQDTTGWWWQNGDGTYPTNQWKEIAGKQYYFGTDGYMLSNTTTPDGYTVGPDGAWIQELTEENRYGLADREGFEIIKELWVTGKIEDERSLRDLCENTLSGSPIMEDLIQEILSTPRQN